jgi:hypothetical protein
MKSFSEYQNTEHNKKIELNKLGNIQFKILEKNKEHMQLLSRAFQICTSTGSKIWNIQMRLA